MGRYVQIFRSALVNENRMCLCGIMSAELNELPPGVSTEVDRFARAKVDWMEKVLAVAAQGVEGHPRREHALAIFAAIEGAQLVARGREDIAIFDDAIRVYRATRLIP